MTHPNGIQRVPDTFRVLDAYSCIGGATAGYQRLGWHVTGVDIQAQPIQWAKGIDWSTDHLRLREALPPAYTEWIGRAYLAHLGLGLAVAA
ncbi:hypothetical protein ACFZAV_06470 [Streptomyces sp. NPDC008343]|uniref:hypothetical protein n=1 Tax=Streptomyces sp. NPDC008343 TaxID=3364828 RepID=UPI0036EA6A53